METSPKQNFSSSQPFENPQNTVVWIWVAIGLLALVHVLRSRISNSKKKMLPPGPRGFPIFGSLHLLGKFPNKAFHRLAQKYGDIMYMRLGLADTIVVSSPQAAELFLKTHDLNFASRAPHEGGKHISFGHRDVIFSEFSTYWRDMRKMCVLELLNNQKINSFKSTRKEEVTLLIASIQEAAKKHARVPVDLSAKVLAFNIDLTCRMVFGKKYPDDEFDKSGFNSVIKETIQLLAAPNLGDLIPFVAPLDLQGFTKNIKAASKALDSLFEKIIDEHLQAKDDERNKDFVDVMLGFMSAESEYKIERANIKALIMNMLVPSLDSSSTTVDWTISELIRNPHAMKKVQKELEAVVGMERMVEESDLEKLEYLDMVLKESSRLHPAIPLLVPHAAIKDCTVNGYYIPKKSRVIINVWAIGRDPSAWTDAEKFIPERFDGNNVDLRGNHFQLLPFGSGRRRCPGIELALIQVKLAVAQLLHCFDWELPNNLPPHELDMTEVFGLSVPRANNLLAIPSYRLHK